MNRLYTTARRLRLVLVAIAALGLLLIPATASAKRQDRDRDRNHNGMPDKWEKRHHISIKKSGMGKADPDKDGLRNRGEWRSRTNPKRADSDRDGTGDANEDRDRDGVDNGNEARERTHPRRKDTDRDGLGDAKEDADRDDLNNGGEDDWGSDPMNPDTDGDGIKDGDESAGKIVSFEGETLTIQLFGGATISGTVDEATYIDCGDSSTEVDEGGEDGDYYGDGDEGFGDEWVDGEAVERPDASEDDSADDESDDFTDDESDDSVDDESDDSVDDAGDDEGDEEDSDDGSDGASDGCGVDSLTAGRVVTEASFSATSDGMFFDAIELAR